MGIITSKLILWIILAYLADQVAAMKVSFFGAGYISMPLQEAKMSTNIRIKFRTQQENAFIFLASGRTDYCLLRLDSGEIHFTFKISNHVVDIRSPDSAKLNDLEWHDIAIQRFDSNITLQVDANIIRKTLPPEVMELNIHFGTVLGGVDEFSDDYLAGINSFRGCISDVFYNNINIIKRAREKTGHATSVGLSWVCSSEFDAVMDDAISFLDNDSYALMTKESNPNGESMTFDIRTIEDHGVVFFNGGIDFVCLEIVDQKLHLMVNKSGSVIELMSPKNVSDGDWHRVVVRYNAATVEIMADDVRTTETFVNSVSKTILELDERYYLGGTTEDIRRKTLYKELRMSEASFKGCIRSVNINSKRTGFPDMNETNGLGVDCIWRYPCIEDNPCLLSGICSQYKFDEFICYCDQAYCIKADYQGSYKIFTETEPELEMLLISPMQLLEGGTMFLSTNFIDVLFDFAKYRLTESAILFSVVQQPKFGSIQHYSSRSNNFVPCKTFSLVDLSTDKVKYVHNGAENFNDHATIDMHFSGDTHKVPDYYLGKHRFLLHANVTAVNDPPVLQIPNNKILRVIEGIEKVLNVDLFTIQDPDSAPNVLIYTILPVRDSQAMFGRFEVDGMASTTFSQDDVNLGKVSYLFNTSTTDSFAYEIMLQVSDGIETSDTVYLPVSVHPLELRLGNNTGLIMIHKSSLILTTSNLSIATNSGDESIDIKYEIVKPPQFGSIQKLRQIDSSWINVDSFTDSQLLLGQIRYVHNTDFPWQDDFKFIASYGLVTTQTFDFRITFTRLRISSKRQTTISINGTKEFILTKGVLLYETVPLPSFPRNIIYKILQPTKYGSIFLEGNPKSAKEMDSFTQLDIDNNRIRYKTHRTSYSSFIDYLEFVVSVSECDDLSGKLKIIFNPYEKFVSKLSYQTKEDVRVQEGDRALITRNNFEILFNTFENLSFAITRAPQNGSLCRYDSMESKIETLTEFALDTLYLGDVYYCHADSESETDSFDLLVLSSELTNMQFVCEVDVKIVLINDNAPYRKSEKIFHVVRGALRTLNQDILQYFDADINTNLSDIHFTHVSSTNGDFYKSGRYTDHFSQDDITNRRIVYQHTGPDVGTASFIVTDGTHEVHGSLEVQASEPFVAMLPANATVVQEGKFVILRNKDLIVQTNLDMKLDEISYEVLKPASYGALMYLGRRGNDTMLKASNFTSLETFTHLDVEMEKLVYWNTEIASMDKIRYRIHIKNISAEGEIIFRIYPSAYWEPLQVRRNQTLYVEESTSVLISKDILEIVHPSISPGDIAFLVTSSPLHGYLEMQSMTFDDEYNCKVFDQSAVNSEKLFYIQAGVNQSTDYFIFDVTNGITWLKGLVLKVVIIPEKLYMTTNVITVVEGKTVTLSPMDIQSFSEYYKSKILEYKITKSPTFGFIIAGNSKVKRFTQKQLDVGSIQYIHNGSENSTDSMTLVAVARNKESVPFEVMISVLPVNDELPVVVTNTGLQVWNGGKYVLKNTDLMAQDYDSPPENLTFTIHHVYGGYLAFTNDSYTKIDQFTQNDINTETVLFVHDINARRNEISFFVTDGLFNTTEQILHITAKPVAILEVKNENLHVFPLTKKQILPDHLHFKCSDVGREIRYNVTVPPSLGQLLYEVMETGTTREMHEFSQDDVDNGRLFYEHTAVMLEFRKNDSFYFDVVADKTDRLLDQKFNIEISVSSGGLLRFLPVSKIYVEEGESAPIKLDFSKILDYLKTRAGINNPELYIEATQTPSHGSVEIMQDGKNANKFHPSDFLTKKVYYVHDHTDTLEDTILMSVYLVQGNIFLCNLSIPVSITPVNDQVFTLVTQHPEITVIEGENRTITRNALLTEDKDTPPDEIVYDVISGPTLGVLMKISDKDVAEELLLHSNQFTQADINNDRIVYIHYGQPQSTTFYFKVSDGQFKPAYEIFNIKIAPISIVAEEHQLPVMLQQGSNAAPLQSHSIALRTNVQQNRLLYNVTNSPLHGIILLNHQPTLRFSQQNLDSGQITYMQTDMNKSNDTFQVNAYIANTNYGAMIDVKVSVEPVITINDVALTSDDKIRLKCTVIANNPLSLKLNKFNPKFVVVKPPRSGTIRKIIRSSGDVENQNDRNTNTFSYKELRSGVVYFVPTDPDNHEISDSFEYTLAIKTVQPAQGVVSIDFRSNDDSNLVIVASNSFTVNYIALASAILGLLTLILAVLLILKFRGLKRKKCAIAKDHPPPLPCPPDLTSVGPSHNYANSDNGSMPVTAASTPLPGFSNIPHCKVIPVESLKNNFLDYDLDDDETDDQAETQHMVPNRYNNPYMDNDTWSSSCDMTNDFGGYSTVPQNPQCSNPLLRRNQYWV